MLKSESDWLLQCSQNNVNNRLQMMPRVINIYISVQMLWMINSKVEQGIATNKEELMLF